MVPLGTSIQICSENMVDAKLLGDELASYKLEDGGLRVKLTVNSGIIAPVVLKMQE